ncbi:MAG: hypothetical protein GXP28_11775 [Planctomycetes bacterium]|nr:hypothetical protein [Planctomycetota bacterium]
MAVAKDIHAVVFRNATATFMARVENASGLEINQVSVASILYTVYELVKDDPTALTPVTGHQDVALVVADVIYDSLQLDSAWTVDAVGYNFRHELDISSDEAFSKAGAVYQVRYELTPVTGQKIVFRFKLRCI